MKKLLQSRQVELLDNLLLVAISIVLAMTLVIFNTRPADAASGLASKPVVYFVPHQDDETISMGASVAAHVATGRPVYMVLITDGSGSGARKKLCDSKKVCLDKPQFSAARNREFVAAAAKLGVPSNQLYYENIVDGTLTLTQAGVIIDKYIAMFGPYGASYKTMSFLDALQDHARLGNVLNNRCVLRYPDMDCRFLQSPMYQIGSTLSTDQIKTPAFGWYYHKAGVQAAVNEYKYYNASLGRYGIGYLSVKNQLDYTYNNFRSLEHKNFSNYASTADRIAASQWMAAHP